MLNHKKVPVPSTGTVVLFKNSTGTVVLFKNSTGTATDGTFFKQVPVPVPRGTFQKVPCPPLPFSKVETRRDSSVHIALNSFQSTAYVFECNTVKMT